MKVNENEKFKKLKEILVNHLSSKVFLKPKILVVDNESIKHRLEEVFKYDIQEQSKYSDDVLFSMKNLEFKVFKICTNQEYFNLPDIMKDNAEPIFN